MMINPLPGNSFDDRLDSAARNAVLHSHLGLTDRARVPVGKDRAHVYLGELGPFVQVTTGLRPMLDAVSGVLSRCSPPKMLRVKTSRIIARMGDLHSFMRFLTINLFADMSMKHHPFTIDIHGRVRGIGIRTDDALIRVCCEGIGDQLEGVATTVRRSTVRVSVSVPAVVTAGTVTEGTTDARVQTVFAGQHSSPSYGISDTEE